MTRRDAALRRSRPRLADGKLLRTTPGLEYERIPPLNAAGPAQRASPTLWTEGDCARLIRAQEKPGATILFLKHRAAE